MVKKFLLDTNAIIHLLSGNLIQPLPAGRHGVSIISEIELLSFPSLSETEEQSIHAFLALLEHVPLDSAVRDQAVVLRRKHGLKLPDAIIAATTMVWNATLLTNDQRLLQMTELTSQSVAISPPVIHT